ncbi:patatin-like phospholipase family protein [Virgibacillus sp. DJP39]|uniref:patatin-like phospholipase family protein n=1 Tax=Virgibacillus sp. DJP39 TaxID=3409790 RepID=UPI003BB499E5
MKIDVVFSGGGVKSFAFLGALRSMEANNLDIERVAGTSAGAILAGLLAANYSRSEVENIITQLNLQDFTDPPIVSKLIPLSKWFYLYYKMGIYKGELLEKWIFNHLAAKNIYTFSDLRSGYLRIVVSDLSLGKLIVIPDDLERVYGIDPMHFSVASAIRMSAGYPYLFIPKKLANKTAKRSIMVDGGLLSNYPLWIFDKQNGKNLRPVLGIKLSDDVETKDPNKIKNVFDMSQALFTTMKQAHDLRYISTAHQKNTIFIPIKQVGATNFTISENVKSNLIALGEKSTHEFLANWPN